MLDRPTREYFSPPIGRGVNAWMKFSMVYLGFHMRVGFE